MTAQAARLHAGWLCQATRKAVVWRRRTDFGYPVWNDGGFINLKPESGIKEHHGVMLTVSPHANAPCACGAQKTMECPGR